MHKGKKVEKHSIEKMRNKLKGRKHTQESIEKIIQSKLGKCLSEEHKKKLSFKLKGKKHSQETKDKISKANKGRVTSDETKEKLSKISKGRVYTNSIVLKNRSDGQKRKTKGKIEATKLDTGEIIGIYYNTVEAARKLNIYNAISSVLNNRIKHIKGYSFKRI